MTAIRIAHPAGGIVVLGEEQRRICAFGGAVKKKLIHGVQEHRRRVARDGALAAQVRLKIGHHQRARDSFSRDIADYQPEPLTAEVEEIVVVATDLPRLNTASGVVERLKRRESLRE